MKKRMIYSIIRTAELHNFSAIRLVLYHEFLSKLEMYQDTIHEYISYHVDDDGVITDIITKNLKFKWNYDERKFIL